MIINGTRYGDSLSGTAEADAIYGGAGPDVLNGLSGDDRLYGGNDNDALHGGSGNDGLFGGDGNDILEGDSGRDRLFGGNGEDTLFGGNGGWHRLYGGEGNDHLYSAGSSLMFGGAGDDTYTISNRNTYVSEVGGSGIDKVVVSFSYRLPHNVENLYLYSALYSPGPTPDTVGIGNALDNDLYATGSAELRGLDGDDRLEVAGLGLLWGGNGDDTYIVRNDHTQIFETAVGGHDVVITSKNFAIPHNVEELHLVGHANGIGRGGDDVIVGSGQGNHIAGRGGNDTLTGGAGPDTFIFDRALGPTNVDTITDFQPSVDRALLRSSVFSNLATFQAHLDPTMFHAGTAAADANDHIIYDQASGNLWYDPDGTGGEAQVLFAVLARHDAVTPENFLIL